MVLSCVLLNSYCRLTANTWAVSCSTLLFVCVQAFLLWSWLPCLAHFLCRVNLIARHTSSTTTSRMDYEIFTATCLVAAQKWFPEIAHKCQNTWHRNGMMPWGKEQIADLPQSFLWELYWACTEPSIDRPHLVQLSFPCHPADDPQHLLKQTRHLKLHCGLTPNIQIPEFICIIRFHLGAEGSENIYNVLKTSEPHQKLHGEIFSHPVHFSGLQIQRNEANWRVFPTELISMQFTFIY